MSESKKARDLKMAQTMTLPALVKRISKALDADDDDGITFLEHFVQTYPPGAASTTAAITKASSVIKKSRLLDLVLEKVLPATFSHIFLGSLKILAVLEDFEQDIYVSEGISKILYSMKENANDELTQVLGCQLLAYLALDDAVRDAMGEDGSAIVEQILFVLNEFNKKADKPVKAALIALSNLCYDRENNKSLVGNAALESLIPLCRKNLDKPSILSVFFLLFRNLSNHDDNRAMMGSLSLISVTSAVLEKYSYQDQPQLVTHCVHTLANLCCGSEENKEICLSAGIIQLLQPLLHQAVDDISVIIAACGTLLHLARHHRCRDKMAELSTVVHIFGLIDRIRDSHPDDLEVPLKLVERLCMHPANRQLLIHKSQPALANLLAIMNKQTGALLLHQSVVKLFARLMNSHADSVSTSCRMILKENQGISTLVTSMNHHQSAKILKDRICNILNALFAEPGSPHDNPTSPRFDRNNNNTNSSGTTSSSSSSSSSSTSSSDNEEDFGEQDLDGLHEETTTDKDAENSEGKNEIEIENQKVQEEAEQAEAAKKKAEEEAEAARKKAEEEAELARKKAEEEEAELARKKVEEEEAELARKKAEEEAEQAEEEAEQAEAAKKKAEEEAELARKKAEEAEATRKKAEEEAELARKKAEEEEAEQVKKAQEEAEAARKKAEEDAELAKKAEEEAEAARKKAEEEAEQAEAARKKAEEEAELAKKAEEEAEQARKKAEEEAQIAKKAEEEAELARKKAEEEAEQARKRAEEAEAARKKAEEEAEQAEAARKKAEEEAALAKKAEEEAEQARKKAEEEAEQAKKAEEEAELVRKKAEEEAEQAKKAEEEAELARKMAEQEAEAAKKAEKEAELAKKSEEEARKLKIEEAAAMASLQKSEEEAAKLAKKQSTIKVTASSGASKPAEQQPRTRRPSNPHPVVAAPKPLATSTRTLVRVATGIYPKTAPTPIQTPKSNPAPSPGTSPRASVSSPRSSTASAPKTVTPSKTASPAKDTTTSSSSKLATSKLTTKTQSANSSTGPSSTAAASTKPNHVPVKERLRHFEDGTAKKETSSTPTSSGRTRLGALGRASTITTTKTQPAAAPSSSTSKPEAKAAEPKKSLVQPTRSGRTLVHTATPLPSTFTTINQGSTQVTSVNLPSQSSSTASPARTKNPETVSSPRQDPFSFWKSKNPPSTTTEKKTTVSGVKTTSKASTSAAKAK